MVVCLKGIESENVSLLCAPSRIHDKSEGIGLNRLLELDLAKAEVVSFSLIDGGPLAFPGLGLDSEILGHHSRNFHALSRSFEFSHSLASVFKLRIEDDARAGDGDRFHHRAFRRFARPDRRTFIVPQLRSLLRKGRIDLVGRPLGAVFAEKVSDNGVRRWSFRRIFVSLRR